MTTAQSAISLILPWSPVKDTVTPPRALASSMARTTFLEFPEVDSPTRTSPGLRIPSTCLLKTRS